MKCPLCDRKAETDLCPNHQEAKDRLEEAYGAWAHAYGALERKAYLDRVITNVQSGQWAKEVAELLRGRLNDQKDA